MPVTFKRYFLKKVVNKNKDFHDFFISYLFNFSYFFKSSAIIKSAAVVALISSNEE